MTDNQSFSAGNYHESRLKTDPRRGQVWASLWRFFFTHRIQPDYTVIDLGAGYGDFINHVRAQRRIAIDQWQEMPEHIQEGVESVVGSITDLGFLNNDSIDYAFASNIFEHISKSDLEGTLNQLSMKLSLRGTLTILQPNYRYCYREYFDDYTHVSIYSHISLCDFLAANGWEVLEVQPRFLPLTIKSRLPSWPFLIGIYLRLPFKPLGKQMLIVARPLKPLPR